MSTIGLISKYHRLNKDADDRVKRGLDIDRIINEMIEIRYYLAIRGRLYEIL